MRLNKISLDFNSLSGLTVPLLPKGLKVQKIKLSVDSTDADQRFHLMPITDEKDILLRSHGNEGAEKFMFFTNGRDITPGDLPNILASETLTPSDLLQNLVLKIK